MPNRRARLLSYLLDSRCCVPSATIPTHVVSLSLRLTTLLSRLMCHFLSYALLWCVLKNFSPSAWIFSFLPPSPRSLFLHKTTTTKFSCLPSTMVIRPLLLLLLLMDPTASIVSPSLSTRTHPMSAATTADAAPAPFTFLFRFAPHHINKYKFFDQALNSVYSQDLPADALDSLFTNAS